ncbi:MAG: hypothetical protein Q4C60_07555 [Eubacteriales bacterium]|nr:hypothetical protein [Eubacteriales bacterium]
MILIANSVFTCAGRRYVPGQALPDMEEEETKKLLQIGYAVEPMTRRSQTLQENPKDPEQERLEGQETAGDQGAAEKQEVTGKQAERRKRKG